MWHLRWRRVAGALAILWVAVSSCSCIAPEARTQNLRVPSPLYFDASALPYQHASVSLAGTRIPCTMDRIVDGDTVSFRLHDQGRLIAEETYEDGPKAFRLISAAGDRYDPPIDLIRYPMVVAGAKTEQESSLIEPGSTRKTLVEVTSVTDKQTLDGFVLDAVRVDVMLDAPKRMLKFWFVKGKGLVRTEIGTDTVREQDES